MKNGTPGTASASANHEQNANVDNNFRDSNTIFGVRVTRIEHASSEGDISLLLGRIYPMSSVRWIENASGLTEHDLQR